ncbi:heavy-metal-associated domain-containing protein [Flavihumibacter rivuli]|uniref:heavy-metal-associated domain-containing protein n=1 Tax=Flavihumibacter rivuli TaxID=2838156 RepID=UPI001BDF2D8D|nr:heavy-metal-associated domain-containing protein [Flavihumibacter rivuli]ULQ55678.1 heavy-metal-associated domain-containing protein [Flavihumibacter rivuli]
MEQLKFKTNIKCNGCLTKARPFLNETAGEDNWEVDLQDPQKVLSVIPEGDITAAEIIAAVKEAGYTAERLS